MIKCNYLFYIKAGSKAGLGHLRRSLAIALHLKKSEKSIYFLVDGDRIPLDLLKKKGFKAVKYTKASFNLFSPKIAVIDQKGDVSAQIRSLRAKGAKICLIDNTSKARLLSDIVIFPVSHFKDKLNWKGYKGKKYIGAKYFPLNEEFLKIGPIKHKSFTILITMGGADPNKLTQKVCNALVKMKECFKALIVIGASFKERDIPSDKRFLIYRNPKNMAKLMASSDIAITAFGTTLYELAYMGIPAIIISNYKQEAGEILAFGKLGTSLILGHYMNITAEKIIMAVKELLNNKNRLLKLSESGKKLVDCKGAVRILKAVRNI